MSHPRLGENLKSLRQKHGWTLQQVSRQTGVAVSTLSKVENDQMSLTYDKLLQISEGLGLSLAEFLSSDDSEIVGLARRSVNHRNDGLRQTTPNYDYLYLSTDITRKRMIPVLTRIRARSLADFGPLLKQYPEFILCRTQDFLYMGPTGQVAVFTATTNSIHDYPSRADPASLPQHLFI